MSLLGVSTIGVKGRFTRAIAYLKKQDACRPGKTAEIKNIRQVRDQERVKSASTQQGGKLFLSGNVVHQAFFWVERERFISILMESFASRIELVQPLAVSCSVLEKIQAKKSPGGINPRASNARY
jgi:DNA primase large subunit